MEKAEADALAKELESMEAEYLKPATDRLRQENDRRERRLHEMAELVKRKAAHVERLDAILNETSQAEPRAIEAELAAVGA